MKHISFSPTVACVTLSLAAPALALTTSFTGPGQAVFETIHPTGDSTSAAGNISHVINVVNDDINVDAGVKGAYSTTFGVQSLSFGGPRATGGRSVISSILTQTAATSAITSIDDYVAISGFTKTLSGDGGTHSKSKGNYYVLYAPMQFGSAAKYTSSYNGAEFDINLLPGSSTRIKTGVHIGHSTLANAAGVATPDSASGSVDDNLLWLDGQSNGVGSRYGIQFGRADLSGQDYGVDHTNGSLIGTDGNSDVGYGINFLTATFSKFAWLAHGSSIDGIGNAKFNSIKSTGDVTASKFQGILTTPASSAASCHSGQFEDDSNYHYVCVSTNKWKRIALTAF